MRQGTWNTPLRLEFFNRGQHLHGRQQVSCKGNERLPRICPLTYRDTSYSCSLFISSLQPPHTILFAPPPKFMSCVFVGFFNNPLNSDSDTHGCMNMGPSIGLWNIYEWPLLLLPHSAPSNYLYLLSNGWRLEIIDSINASDLAWCAFMGIMGMICREDSVS